MSDNKPKHYISQKEFFDSLIDSRIRGYMTNEFGAYIITLCEKYATHRNFNRYYHLRDDLVASAIRACCNGFYKYRPFRDASIVWDEQTPLEYDYTIHNNLFAFMSTCAHNSMLQTVQSEYGQSNIINEMKLTQGMEASYGYTEAMKSKEEKEKEESDFEEPIPDPSLMNQSLWQGYDDVNSLVEAPEPIIPEEFAETDSMVYDDHFGY